MAAGQPCDLSCVMPSPPPLPVWKREKRTCTSSEHAHTSHCLLCSVHDGPLGLDKRGAGLSAPTRPAQQRWARSVLGREPVRHWLCGMCLHGGTWCAPSPQQHWAPITKPLPPREQGVWKPQSFIFCDGFLFMLLLKITPCIFVTEGKWSEIQVPHLSLLL